MTEYPPAPDFPPSLQWLNCAPQSLAASRGRVTALVFWHAASATSANLLDDMAYLQGRYADGLRVIAVHVPKFDAQRDAGLASAAVSRLGLRFPVASDADAVLWQYYGVRAWPSVAWVDVQGRLVEIIAGDQQRDVLEQRLVQLLDAAAERGLRVYENASLVARTEPLTEVAFPSGLALTPERLYVSDSGHHRILECTHEGRVLRVFGSGKAGFFDGLGIEAAFHEPAGLGVFKDMLYVADAGNHAIRRIRLATGDVDTLIGEGESGIPQAVADVRGAGVRLDQPSDVAFGSDRVFISMAASNQVWELDLVRHALRPLAGSGRLALVDGVGALAGLAQPAGLVLAQHRLYVCDSQSSSVRCIDTVSGEVRTLLGHGVFEFGCADGTRETARLQCPQDIALDPDAATLWIADSYNNAIAAFSLDRGELLHFQVPHPLRCPTGIVSDGKCLWIANTDAHEVLRWELGSAQVDVLPMTP